MGKCYRNTKLSAIYLFCALILCWQCVSSYEDRESALILVEQKDNGSSQEDSTEGVVEVSEAATQAQEVFYPTKEWQTVKPGQAIPRGLHVRMNLETGVNEAKLLEEDSNDMKYWNKDGRQGMLNSKSKAFSRDELKQALKKFKTETFTDKETQENIDKVKKQFRSYETLKEQLKLMEMSVKTDSEIVTELVAALKNGGLTHEETANVLRSLEYYVHQIDNAVLFGDLGGMTIIQQSLNSSHPDLRKEASAVLGAATQSNPKVQIKALEHGLLDSLLRRLSIDQSKDLQKVHLFALSSMLRHFPYAQSKFLQLGGLSVLSALFNMEESGVLRVKTVTLLHDLLLEKEYAMNSNDMSLDQSKKVLYSGLPLVESLVQLGWCERIPALLASSTHDANEKALCAMMDLTKHCAMKFVTFVPTLRELRTEYAQLVQQELLEDPTGSYFNSFLRYIDDILHKLSVKDEL